MRNPALYGLLSALLLTSCSTVSAPSVGAPSAVAIEFKSTKVPMIRGCRLSITPHLLELQLGEALAQLEPRPAVVEVTFLPSPDQFVQSQRLESNDPQMYIEWFTVQYVAKNATGEVLYAGQASAVGPEPASFGDCERNQRAVVQNVCTKVLRQVHESL